MPPDRLALVAPLVVALASCASPRSTDRQTPAPIVIQGAMDVEVQALVAAIEHPAEEHVQGWTFWRGTLDGSPIVISKTSKGMANAAAATALAIDHYHPRAIINQGTAGGHDPDLHVADIVVGTASVNTGAFRTGERARGAGTDFREWRPMDLIRTDGSAGQDPSAWVMRRFPGDARLVSAAHAASARYTKGRVVDGVLASSDVWNSELDRIARLHDEFGTSAEEMETAAAAQIAQKAGVPFAGVRILSNNITNHGAYDGATAAACQQFVVGMVREYLRAR